MPQRPARLRLSGLLCLLQLFGAACADREAGRIPPQAPLDHVQITLESHREDIHNEMVKAPAWRETIQGIRNALDADLYTITNTYRFA